MVRHGQATPFEEEKDRLSAKGALQARRLGEYWIRRGSVFDHCYCGSLVRQRHTVDLVVEAYGGAGLAWPPVQIVDDLNEYDVERVLTRLLPLYAKSDPDLGTLLEARKRSAASPEHNTHFQRLFEAVMLRWVREPVPRADVEPWGQFRDRVRRGLRRITDDAGSGKKVVAFTSGGPVGVAVQTALGAPDLAALEVNWRVRNCSLTEFLFSGDRFTLDHFNGIPHLEDPALWTYR